MTDQRLFYPSLSIRFAGVSSQGVLKILVIESELVLSFDTRSVQCGACPPLINYHRLRFVGDMLGPWLGMSLNPVPASRAFHLGHAAARRGKILELAQDWVDVGLVSRRVPNPRSGPPPPGGATPVRDIMRLA